jgi:hypothetical protein
VLCEYILSSASGVYYIELGYINDYDLTSLFEIYPKSD